MFVIRSYEENMHSGEQILVAYGWHRLFCDIMVAALSKNGWPAIGSLTEVSEPARVGMVLVYGSRSPAHVVADIQRAQAHCVNAKVMVLGGDITDDESLTFIRAGAAAYVNIRQRFAELLESLNMLRDNRCSAPGRITWLVLENISRLADQRDADAHSELTGREKQIIDLLKSGLSNKEIAERLSIAPNTVKHHVHRLLGKLNVKSRHEAVWVESQTQLPAAG
jgi:DNA-binding NarL/FixJ family response regulator